MTSFSDLTSQGSHAQIGGWIRVYIQAGQLAPLCKSCIVSAYMQQNKTMRCGECAVEWRMRMLFTLLLTALTATSGKDTHTLQ